MQSEIDDGKTKDAVCHDQENNKLDEPAKTQLREGNPGEFANSLPNKANPDDSAIFQLNEGNPDGPANSQPNEGKPDEPEVQCKEKADSEKTLQHADKHDQPESALQNIGKPDGKQRKRKLILKKKKKNVGNGNVEQNILTTIKPKLAQQKKAKFAKPEGSGQEKNLELVKVVDQLSKGNIDVPEGTDQERVKDENNGDASKGVRNKKRRQRAKKGKGSAGFKMEKLKQKIGEASGSMNSEKMKLTGKLSSHAKGLSHDKTKDKLGGLIFMCSSKTKPDCFRYSVMGVTMNKKDLVLRIKPGLKLFLYDFDLKLLYGVYRATSSGGTKLEPAAFGGAFPVQVKFEVFKDCYPLPESVFKKAIKENYNEKRKFKTELTFEQVKKLTTLFRTVGVSSNAHKRSPPAKRNEDTEGVGEYRTHSSRARSNRDEYTYGREAMKEETSRDSEVHGGVGEYRTHSSRARSNRDEYTYGREAMKEETSRDSYLSEREYRMYGLLGRRRSRSPPRHASSLVPRVDLEREAHVRYPVPVYGDTTTSIRQDPLLVGRSDSQPYTLEGRRELPSSIRHEPTVLDGRRYLPREPISQLDYQTHRPPAVRQNSGLELNRQQYTHPSYDLPDNPYTSSIGRDELAAGPYYSLDGRRVVFLPETDSLQRREPEVAAFASSAAYDHNQGYAYQEAHRHDPLFAPVSSRYSFAGPSFYR